MIIFDENGSLRKVTKDQLMREVVEKEYGDQIYEYLMNATDAEKESILKKASTQINKLCEDIKEALATGHLCDHIAQNLAEVLFDCHKVTSSISDEDALTDTDKLVYVVKHCALMMAVMAVALDARSKRCAHTIPCPQGKSALS